MGKNQLYGSLINNCNTPAGTRVLKMGGIAECRKEFYQLYAILTEF